MIGLQVILDHIWRNTEGKNEPASGWVTASVKGNSSSVLKPWQGLHCDPPSKFMYLSPNPPDLTQNVNVLGDRDFKEVIK